MIPIGWPLGKYGRPPRKPVDTCLFWEHFDAEEEARRLAAWQAEEEAG